MKRERERQGERKFEIFAAAVVVVIFGGGVLVARRPYPLLRPLSHAKPPHQQTKKQLLLSAQFLHNELPVRLAHRVAELENLPYGLSAKAHVLKVRDWYVSSFTDLRRFPKVKDAHDERAFTDLLRSIYERHKNVVPVMAMGVAELKQELFGKDDESGGSGSGGSASERARRRLSSLDELPEIHSFLDGFYLSRIGIRMLIGQHIALHEPQPASHYIGMVRERGVFYCLGFLEFWGGRERERAEKKEAKSKPLEKLTKKKKTQLKKKKQVDTKCSPVAVARAAIDDARAMCSREYGGAPDVVVYG